MDANVFSACDIRFGAALVPGGARPVAALRGAASGDVGASSAAEAAGLGEGAPATWELDCGGEPAALRAAVDGAPAGVDFCLRLAWPPAGARAAGAVLAPGLRLAERAAARGALAAVLVEFDPSFAYGPESRKILDEVLRSLAGLPAAALFLNRGWYTSRVVEGLKERGAALCLADMPRGPDSPPSVDVVTSPLVYVRFMERPFAARAEAELLAWLPRLEALAVQAERIRCVFADPGAGRAEAARLAALWKGGSGVWARSSM